MVFSSPFFLFAFFPAVLALYFLAPSRFRNSILLLASGFFYAWGEPRFIFVVIVSAWIDWLLGGLISRSGNVRWRKTFVALGIVSNAGLLVCFKYLNFFFQSVSQVAHALHLAPSPLLTIALPIGVSFIVFEKITYLVDIYRGTGKPAMRFASYVLYVMFFPKLLAGPIIKYHEIAEQLDNRSVRLDDFSYGVMRFCFGLAKKVLIADALGAFVDTIFAMDPAEIGFRYAWIGLICFTLQIFFDFSGYSDMAIGMARMFGFRLMENFDSPYIASNFTEFWRRWHISLSTWIREYLYYPLGGNRISSARTYVNLWICFLISGLWHGAKWTFVLWGIYQGTFIVLDKLFWIRASQRIPRWLNITLCFLLVMLGWVLFRSESVGFAVDYARELFLPGAQPVQVMYITRETPALIAIGLLLSFLPVWSAYSRQAVKPGLQGSRAQTIQLMLAAILFVVAISKVAGTTFQPFLYFRF